MISIVLPVFNEELILKENTLKVFDFCQKNIKEDWQIIISDNASTDKSSQIAKLLSHEFKQIRYYHSESKGKGCGVIKAWQNFKSYIYIFMDIDLSTELKALPQLIDGINSGNDLVVGSRFIQGAQVKRLLGRKIISSVLRILLKLFFKLRVKDAPCGFKAVNQKVIDNILPKIQNKTWFFDTEMLILAQRQNYKTKEIPVVWHESVNQLRKSKVKTTETIKDYLKNIFSLYARK